MHAQKRAQSALPPFTPLTDQEFFFFTRMGREDLLAAYLELKRHCWTGKNTCWPSVERQAEETGRKLATVRRRLQDLEQLGVIRVVRASESRQRGNRYILTPADEWVIPGQAQHKRMADAAHRPDTDRPRSLNPDRLRALDPDRQRSPKQIDALETDPEETDNQVPIARTGIVSAIQPKTERQDVVVSQEISEDIRGQLLQLGVEVTPSFTVTLCRSATADVERALSCLKAAKRVDNPTGYFLAALKGNWAPPASLSAARQKRDTGRTERAKGLCLEIEQLGRQLETVLAGVDLDQEADDWLAAEEEMRRMLSKPARTEVELSERREEVKAERHRQRQVEEAQQRRRLELLQWELERLSTDGQE